MNKNTVTIDITYKLPRPLTEAETDVLTRNLGTLHALNRADKKLREMHSLILRAVRFGAKDALKTLIEHAKLFPMLEIPQPEAVNRLLNGGAQ
jgi:hypothetical protein